MPGKEALHLNPHPIVVVVVGGSGPFPILIVGHGGEIVPNGGIRLFSGPVPRIGKHLQVLAVVLQQLCPTKVRWGIQAVSKPCIGMSPILCPASLLAIAMPAEDNGAILSLYPLHKKQHLLLFLALFV